MVFLVGGQKAQDTESFFKVTPLIWAIEGQKYSHFLKNSQPREGEVSGEVGMVSQLVPVFNYESFIKMTI